MQIKLNKRAQKGYEKLPPEIKKKANKKLLLLDIDINHPQLYTKKMQGYIDRWEARIDYQYGLASLLKKIQLSYYPSGLMMKVLERNKLL